MRDERDRASCASELTRPLDNRLDAAEVVRAIWCSYGLSPGDLLAPGELLATLRRNKVPLLSLAFPAAISAPPEIRVALDSPEFGAAWRAEQARCAEAHEEYVRLVQAWAQLGIPCLCITSVGIAPSFPYAGDNVDLLVPAEQVRDARRVLLDLGYVEMTNTDEPLGWLFGHFVGGRTVSLIHLHAHVAIARSAIGFLLEEELWRRAQQAPDDPWVQVPGREDAVLIALAYALLSGEARSELSLHDLLRVRHVLADGSLDWAYLERVAHERGWADCLALGLLVVAQLEEQLFAHSRIPAAQRERCARTLSWWGRRYRERLRGHSPTLPFRISFVASQVLFFAKLWRDRHLEASRKPAQTVLALAHGLTQRSGLHLQNAMLIALSGVDGSGKSTQARALRDAFAAGHVRSRIVWTRIGDTPLLRLLHSARKRYEQSKGTLTQRTFSRTSWRLVLWAIVASADYAAWLQYVRWRLWRGDVVIADRYLCDFEVELGIRLRNAPHLAALLLRILRSLAPTPKRAYLLQVDPALTRTRTTASDFSDLDPADMQRRYDALTHRYGLRAYDASRPLDELATALVHDALTAYMAAFRQRVRALFFFNPRQLNPGGWRTD
jgi:thymidylate kinase